MDANTIKVYEILKTYWGENKASVVLDYLDNETTLKVKRAVVDKIGNLATREDILKLETATREDILKIDKNILELKAATREDILKLDKNILELKAATREDITKVKVEMIRWYVALFVMLMLMIAGLYLK